MKQLKCIKWQRCCPCYHGLIDPPWNSEVKTCCWVPISSCSFCCQSIIQYMQHSPVRQQRRRSVWHTGLWGQTVPGNLSPPGREGMLVQTWQECWAPAQPGSHPGRPGAERRATQSYTIRPANIVIKSPAALFHPLSEYIPSVNIRIIVTFTYLHGLRKWHKLNLQAFSTSQYQLNVSRWTYVELNWVVQFAVRLDVKHTLDRTKSRNTFNVYTSNPRFDRQLSNRTFTFSMVPVEAAIHVITALGIVGYTVLLLLLGISGLPLVFSAIKSSDQTKG